MNFKPNQTDRRSKMFRLIEVYHKSGQSQKHFSEENNLSLSTFLYWLRKYRKEKSQAGGFIPLQLSGNRSTSDCRIELPNRVIIYLSGSGNAELISGLITQAVSHHAAH